MNNQHVCPEDFESSGAMDFALHATSLGILAIDENRRIVQANASARSMLGLPQDVVGRDLFDALPDWGAFVEDAPEDGSVAFSFEQQRASRPDLSVIVAPPDERGGRVVVCRELPMHDAASGVPSGSDLVSRLDGLLGRFSHEMRNPMASVLAGLQALERAGSLSTDDSFILKLVIAEARSAIAIIERFTNSLRNGTTAVQRVPVDALLQNILTEFGERARKVQISLELIPGPSGIWVAADEQALSRALEKLTYNALEACEKNGSIHLGWRVLSEDEKQRLFPRYQGKVLAIFGRDSGDGLPQYLPQRSLFEPFVTTKPSHVGLGLTVARSIVENHGGVVTLSSLVPEGTEFEVFLPLGERLNCSEVMDKQTADSEERSPCEACEVKQANAGEICWVAKSRSDVSGQGFPPQTCAKCPFFEASNLASFFKPSGPR